MTFFRICSKTEMIHTHKWWNEMYFMAMYFITFITFIPFVMFKHCLIFKVLLYNATLALKVSAFICILTERNAFVRIRILWKYWKWAVMVIFKPQNHKLSQRTVELCAVIGWKISRSLKFLSYVTAFPEDFHTILRTFAS